MPTNKRPLEDGPPFDPPWDTWKETEAAEDFVTRVAEEIMDNDQEWAIVVGDELDCVDKSELARGLFQAMKKIPECVQWMERIAEAEAWRREDRRPKNG